MSGFRFFALLLASVSLVSCSSFEREWSQSVADYEAGKLSAPYGPWAGTWTTKTNGHSGDLKAIVKPSSKTEGGYTFRYHANWGAFFQGTYSVDFPVTKQGTTYYVDGEKSLGPFGTFGHKATINSSRFDATYSNDKGDLGAFSMKRP